MQINRVGIIGSGVMGAGIAAHLANVGIPTLMLDIVPSALTQEEQMKGLTLQDRAVRNRLARMGKERLSKTKPPQLYDAEDLDLIEIGNLEDDMQKLENVDWIIEVIVENLEAKQALYEKIERIWRPGMIVSSNTSGISIAQMVAKRSLEFRRSFMGTHFFNPPRYMKLLEIIPGPDTRPELITAMKAFARKCLGKGVVVAKDTPNFIANRIGTYGLMVAAAEMKRFGLSFDEVDELTGPVLGRPKSATFRTLDIVGLDTFVHVANNVRNSVQNEWERQAFAIPAYMQEMLQRGWIGDKSGQGFYKKTNGNGKKEILTLHPDTMEYVQRKKVKSSSLEAAKQAPDVKAKIRTLLSGQDAASQFVWQLCKQVLLYSAEHAFTIADDLESIDQGMKWGFNWELGPFELWDVLGLEKTVKRMLAEGDAVPGWVLQLLEEGKSSFYSDKIESIDNFYIGKSSKGIGVIKQNSGATLYDIGDGVALLDVHSLKQAIGPDVVSMLRYACAEGADRFDGLVIGARTAANFCVGANLLLLLMEIQDDNWDDVNWMVKQFQDACMGLKYFSKPVVAAPFGLTLGGGAELAMACDTILATAETYMGLVEVGVGLIPGGGGNKELLIRHLEKIMPGIELDLQPFINHVFELIGTAKVGSSAKELRKLGFMRATDRISLSRDLLLADAKREVLHMLAQGYRAPVPRSMPVVGREGAAVLKVGVMAMKEGRYISSHDQAIANKLIHVLTGGDVAKGTRVSEQYLLDLEREAFLSLCGEAKTQQRMQHMLTTGKPLRN
ncbi:3-hydroxyacyl-CoA dehydrogenase/enoyl-CoA hydratase family protein [Fodinisporobacter ferrooxydans]|uniref:3-hydroxyacyl-CoA dehydrogenase/enoyl-CoA hydratase family protein n=1 Tax=Fodinisporobacter ferrooxydans TaxID=2901836 RepID=A0ABY4CRP7_9BACL|nr:3-hydroxyacyl-CoA dehydrogenase/enoyl-CoA hydratase family protein [Alicyclobacillaceae bacterium MYW30-H2]